MTAKKTTATKTTWAPAWGVHPDGTHLVLYEMSDTGKPTIQVRKRGGSGPGERLLRAVFLARYAMSPEVAIETYQMQTQRAVIDATRELQQAQAEFARALALTPTTVEERG